MLIKMAGVYGIELFGYIIQKNKFHHILSCYGAGRLGEQIEFHWQNKRSDPG
jgi:hypothetical protein